MGGLQRGFGEKMNSLERIGIAVIFMVFVALILSVKGLGEYATVLRGPKNGVYVVQEVYTKGGSEAIVYLEAEITNDGKVGGGEYYHFKSFPINSKRVVILNGKIQRIMRAGDRNRCPQRLKPRLPLECKLERG